MKVTKKLIHGKESRVKMMEAINITADVVGSTLGAKGRNVILDKDYGSPMVVNDGVTCIREIFFDEPIKNMGVQLLKDASARTNSEAGDGTTGTVVVARAMIEKGWHIVEQGENPVMVRKSLEKAVEKVRAALEISATPIKEEAQIIQVAQISVQDEELGEKIGKMMFEIGSKGAVTLKSSMKPGVFIEKEGGMRLEGQLTGGVVDNGDRWETVLEKARVLILKDDIQDHEFESKWVPFARNFADARIDAASGQQVVTKVNVPVFLVIAEKLSRRIIMMMNQNKDIIRWVWFRPTTALLNMKEIYKDLQAITGGKIVCEEEGNPLMSMAIEDMGLVEKATIGRHDAVLVVSKDRMVNDAYLDRCVEVKGQIENAEDAVEEEQIEHRYANLTGGVASIEISAGTEQATIELQLRIEDAVNATRSAMEEGIVSGGGVALLDAAAGLDEEDVGEAIMKEACEAPIKQILRNAGYSEDKIEVIVLRASPGVGVNVLTDEEVNMKDAGIIDPLKVVKQELINASSVAGLLLTSEYAITTEEDHTDSVRKFFNPPKQ